jgi:hydroxymethylbilane synthase
LGLEQRIRQRLTAPHWLPAPAQGAIAIECRSDAKDVLALCAALAHPETTRQVSAERAMNRALHGSCHVPVAAYCEARGAGLHLQGLVGSAETGEAIRAEAEGDDPEALGKRVAEQLLALGAGRLLG